MSRRAAFSSNLRCSRAQSRWLDADARLRRGDVGILAGAPERAHAELSEMTLGLFGFGHIGRTIAGRAKAFDMTVVVANRSAVPASPLVDGAFALGDAAFWSAADAIVVSLPLTEGTRGIVGKAEFAAMRPDVYRDSECRSWARHRGGGVVDFRLCQEGQGLAIPLCWGIPSWLTREMTVVRRFGARRSTARAEWPSAAGRGRAFG